MNRVSVWRLCAIVLCIGLISSSISSALITSAHQTSAVTQPSPLGRQEPTPGSGSVEASNSQSNNAATGTVDADMAQWPRVIVRVRNDHSYWMSISEWNRPPDVTVTPMNDWARFGYIPGGIGEWDREEAVYQVQFPDHRQADLQFFVNAGRNQDDRVPAALLTIVQIVAEIATGEQAQNWLGLLGTSGWQQILDLMASMDSCLAAAESSDPASLAFNLLQCLSSDANIEAIAPYIDEIAGLSGKHVVASQLKRLLTVWTILQVAAITWDQALSIFVFDSWAGSVIFRSTPDALIPILSPQNPKTTPTAAPTASLTPPLIGASPGPAQSPIATPSLAGLTYVSGEGDLMLVGDDGATSRLVEGPVSSPAWSPDGSQLAYVRIGADGSERIEVAGADGSNPRVIVEPEPHSFSEGAYWSFRSVRWSPDNASVYYFRSFTIRGSKVISHVDLATGNRQDVSFPDILPYGFDISPDGAMVLIGEPIDANVATLNLYLREVGGSTRRVRALPGNGSYSDPIWSPDGATMTIWIEDELMVMERDGTEVQRLPLEADRIDNLSWSQDGGTLAYATSLANGNEWSGTIWTVVPATGGGPAEHFAGTDPTWRNGAAPVLQPTRTPVMQTVPASADPTSTSLVRIQNMACPGTDETSFHISPLPFAIDPGPDCTAPTTAITITDEAGTVTPYEVPGHLKLNLPTGSYTITESASGATAPFDLPMDDSREQRPSECDGHTSCVSIVVSMPPASTGGSQGDSGSLALAIHACPDGMVPASLDPAACSAATDIVDFSLGAPAHDMPVLTLADASLDGNRATWAGLPLETFILQPEQFAPGYARILIPDPAAQIYGTDPDDGVSLAAGSGYRVALTPDRPGVSLDVYVFSSASVEGSVPGASDPADTSHVQLQAMACPDTPETSIAVFDRTTTADWGISCFAASATISIRDATGQSSTYTIPYAESVEITLPPGAYTVTDLDSGRSMTLELPLPSNNSSRTEMCDGHASCAVVVVRKPLVSEGDIPGTPELQIRLTVTGTPPPGTEFALYLNAPDIGLLVCEQMTDPDGDGVYLSRDLAVPSWPAGTEGFAFPGGRVVEGVGYIGNDPSESVPTTCFAEERRTIETFELQDVTEDTMLTVNVDYGSTDSMPSTGLPNAYRGTWEGWGVQSNPAAEWPVTITLTGGSPGAVVGVTDYPTYACGGNLLLESIEGDTVVLTEHLTYGEAACADGGTFTLGLLSDGGLGFEWFGTRTSASGTLYRTASGVNVDETTIPPTTDTAPPPEEPSAGTWITGDSSPPVEGASDDAEAVPIEPEGGD